MTIRGPLTSRISNATTALTSGAARTGLFPVEGLSATQLQAAITELLVLINARASIASLNNHLNDTSDAHDASAISYAGATGMSATDVEAAIDELVGDIAALGGGGPIAASGVTYAGSANLASTNVEAALDELDSEKSGTSHAHTQYLPLTFFYTGDVSTKTGVGHDIAIVAGTLDVIRVVCDSAPAGGTVTITFVKEAGGPGGTATTIGSITLAIASKSGSTTGLSVSLAAGDTVRIDVTTNAGYTAASCKNLTGKARYSY